MNKKKIPELCRQTKLMLLVSWSPDVLWGFICGDKSPYRREEYSWTKLISYIWVIQVVGTSRLLISTLSAVHSRVKACNMPRVMHTFQRLLAFSLGSSVTKPMLRFCTTLLGLIFSLKATEEHKKKITVTSKNIFFPLDSSNCGGIQTVRWTLTPLIPEFLVTAVFTPFFQSLPAFAGRHIPKTEWHSTIY